MVGVALRAGLPQAGTYRTRRSFPWSRSRALEAVSMPPLSQGSQPPDSVVYPDRVGCNALGRRRPAL